MNLDQEINKIDKEIEEKRSMHQALITEIEQVRLKETLLRAELAGLEERRRALAEAAAPYTGSSDQQPVAPVRGTNDVSKVTVEVTKLTLVEATKQVIDNSTEPMRIEDVRRQLRKLGRRDDASSVSVTLHYLYSNEKIRRVARGVYAPL